MRQLPLWLAAAWAMSLTVVGLMVVPMLFVHLPTPAMAGQMAAKLFAAQTWVSVVCGALLLMTFRSNQPLMPVNTAQAATLFVVAGVLLALLVELAVAPRIVARDNLALWHKAGSAMYFTQWVCALVVFAKLAAAATKASHTAPESA
ncbi:hypothetical protein CHU94_11860 [Rhodoferax sp. TH121]|uniref:DUF4149 domain-containing protein n=1 Tax=Rhodoferax sp. TH121 TaxID=2022803 RepID=UPI000B96E373|nr:DUF4149 domain-containing protein [Rhodoferax sp. TH121]OYQ40021.1 hypothetical protein CHU94_11860 [Rhodoferax sp. TH121]